MFITGFMVFLGVALILVKLPRRLMLRALKYDLSIDIAEQVDAGDPKLRVIPLLRSFTVFNIAQVDGLPESSAPVLPRHEWDPLVAAEMLLADSGARIQHGGNRAYYRPSDDIIQLPPREWFPTAADYYATALHELTHWTGAPSRCNRPLGKRHGIDAYAYEELVAEMGAAFACAHCHLPARMEHASYIDSWLAALRNDNDTPPPLTDQDTKTRTDAAWKEAADAFRGWKDVADEAQAKADAAKARLIELATHSREAGYGVAVTRYWKAGNVDYKKVPELQGVNLEQYRGKMREEVRVTIER